MRKALSLAIKINYDDKMLRDGYRYVCDHFVFLGRPNFVFLGQPNCLVLGRPNFVFLGRSNCLVLG